MRNVLITGLPRSGTTMVCQLLNKIPNVVALHEPMDLGRFFSLGHSDIVSGIADFFSDQRSQIISSGTARSKSKGGAVPSNSLSDIVIDGKRPNILDGRQILVQNVDRTEFDLFIKHPSFFSSLLPVLEAHFECYACIRNPLSVLLSWTNANMAVTEGRAPAAEKMDKELEGRLNDTPGRLDRQLILLDFFFSRYALSKSTKIVRYEDVVASGGKALSALHPMAMELSENLSSRNSRNITSEQEFEILTNRLLESDNACWQFYSRASVVNLLNVHG